MIKKIPVFGTQSLNSLTNLKNFIKSIDYPIETLSLVINNENINFFLELKSFCDSEVDKNLIERIDISYHPTNLGCAASWNYHIKNYPSADFIFISNEDIICSPGSLKEMVDELENCDMVFHDQTCTRYALFAINKTALKKVGLFDENMYPCNFEDNDFDNRCSILNIKRTYLNLNTFHISSGTSRNITPEEHKKYLANYIVTTEEYFNKKWNNEFGDPMRWDYNFDYRENKIFRYSKYY